MAEPINPTHVGGPGAQGTLVLYPPDKAGGTTEISMPNNTADVKTTVTFAAMAAARTITYPDPGGDAFVAMSTAALTRAELDILDGATLSTAELNILDGVTATAAELNKVDGIPASVTVAVTTPGASGTCDAAFTFKDAAGVACAFATAFVFYLSGSTGLALTAAITSIDDADTDVGDVGVLTAEQSGIIITTAAGLASAKLTGTAATTYYLTFIGPGGRLIVSPALLTKA